MDCCEPSVYDDQFDAGEAARKLREYRRDSAQLFTTYVGYYDKQVQGKTIHSPKNCLPGAGWEILNTSSIALPGAEKLGQVNRVLLANKGTRALVYYWYQGRGRIESNEYKVKWNLLRDAALFGRTEEALVRIVVPRKVPEGGSRLRFGEIGSARQLQHAPQLVEVVLVGQRQVLVEPLGRHHLGGRAPFAPAIGELDARAGERLRAFGERHHAEAEGQPQHNRPLVQLDFADDEAWRVSHGRPVLP